MDVVNVAMFYLVIISDITNEFLPGDNKDLLNGSFEHLLFLLNLTKQITDNVNFKL